MKNFDLVSGILAESYEPNAISHDPEIMKIKKKAAAIRAKADLIGANNQIQKAKIDSEKIRADKELEQKQTESKFPNNAQPQQQVSPVQAQQGEVDLNSGDPINRTDDVASNDVPGAAMAEQGETYDRQKYNLDEEQAQQPNEMEQIPGEDDQQGQPATPVAGQEPQTKDEAEIAQIQAKTREIQTKIGEYTPQGAAIDPNQMQMGPGVGGMPQVDPTTGQPVEGMPAGMPQVDPMTGMPIQPQDNDPMKGLGDTTDKTVAMGVPGMGGMGINPMTGMPMEMPPSKTPTTIGRLYMLKKMYYRLELLDKTLRNCSDPEILELAKVTAEAFEIFRIIIQNLKIYKDKIDEILVDYYTLLKDLSQQAEQHFKQKNIDSQD